jgi:hypothetical protein
LNGRALHCLAFIAPSHAQAVATIVTYPLQLAQTRLRSGVVKHGGPAQPGDLKRSSSLVAPTHGSYTGTVDCLTQILKKNGLRGACVRPTLAAKHGLALDGPALSRARSGWFRGMEAKLWQTVLTAAFQFLTCATGRAAWLGAIALTPARPCPSVRASVLRADEKTHEFIVHALLPSSRGVPLAKTAP